MNTITDIKEVNELRTLSLNLFNKHGYPTSKDYRDWETQTYTHQNTKNHKRSDNTRTKAGQYSY